MSVQKPQTLTHEHSMQQLSLFVKEGRAKRREFENREYYISYPSKRKSRGSLVKPRLSYKVKILNQKVATARTERSR